MTAKDEALIDLAAAHQRVKQLTDQLAEARQARLQRVADARNEKATWDEIGKATGQGRDSANAAYKKHLEVTVEQRVQVKPTAAAKEKP